MEIKKNYLKNCQYEDIERPKKFPHASLWVTLLKPQTQNTWTSMCIYKFSFRGRDSYLQFIISHLYLVNFL